MDIIHMIEQRKIPYAGIIQITSYDIYDDTHNTGMLFRAIGTTCAPWRNVVDKGNLWHNFLHMYTTQTLMITEEGIYRSTNRHYNSTALLVANSYFKRNTWNITCFTSYAWNQASQAAFPHHPSKPYKPLQSFVFEPMDSPMPPYFFPHYQEGGSSTTPPSMVYHHQPPQLIDQTPPSTHSTKVKKHHLQVMEEVRTLPKEELATCQATLHLYSTTNQ